MKRWKKRISLLISAAMIFSLTVNVSAAETQVTILYTNDIHTYIDNYMDDENGISYSKVAALKDQIPNAILVDAGDHLQGTAFGQMDEGMTMIRLMNTSGYDVATFGNHEFDYGMEGCMNAVEAAAFTYVSSNFCHVENGIDGKSVVDGWKILEAGNKKIAFVGITTPETLTSTAASTYQNKDGEYIYGFYRDTDGSALYEVVQKNIDEARNAGADYVIALGHLGTDSSSSPWTSYELIANTTGLDAFIDGHSHTMIPMDMVMNKTGELVLLTQTGFYLNHVGKMTISSDGIETELLSAEDLKELKPNADVKTLEDAWINEIENELNTVIGYSEIVLDNYDETGNRLVRKQSTNSGDFAADALYYLFDEMGLEVDVAVMNGGGIRNNAITGELSYFTCKEMHPFGNVACLLQVTGQQLLDALEWASKDLAADGSRESGSLLHISGGAYTIDLSEPSTVQQDTNGIWTGPPTSGYRIKDLKIMNGETGIYEPIDLNATYYLAGYNYTLRDLGGGFSMLKDAVNVLDYVAEDYMVLANYITSFPVNEKTGLPTIGTDDGYADLNGTGRIIIQTEPMTEETETDKEEVVAERLYKAVKGDSLWKISRRFYGTGTRWNILYDANKMNMESPDLLTIGQELLIP